MMQANIEQLIQQNQVKCVRALADKYGFDPLEAMASLQTVDTKPKIAPEDKKAIAAKKKADREAKKLAKADKPKRAPTGYLLFCKAERPTVKEQHTEFKPQEVVKELARRWKNVLTEEERSEWNVLAKTPPESDSDDIMLEDEEE